MAGYIAIPSQEALEKFESSTENGPVAQEKHIPRRRRQRISRYWPWLAHILFFSISVSAGLFVRHSTTCSASGSTGALLKYHPYDRKIRFNGTFHRDSPYKGPPSLEVDKAWEKILPIRLMSISEEVFQQINTSEHSVKTPPYLGEGRLAIFEGLHHLHCVRSLWKAAYPEYYTEEAEFSRTNHEEWAEHIDHCADMLRQKFMCEADSNLITYSWLKNHYNPHPNFNVEHQCRDWSRLMDAVDKYGIPLEAVPEGGIRRPADVEVVDFVEPPFDPLAIS